MWWWLVVPVAALVRLPPTMMPSLLVQSASTPVSGAPSLCQQLSKSVTAALGKPESYVLTSFQKVDAMSFGGDAETPAAALTLVSLGAITPDNNRALSAAVAQVLNSELGVPQNRYYINFFDSDRSNVGYNGATF